MKKSLSVIALIFFSVLILSCGNGSRIPMDKSYWTPEDYDIVYWEVAEMKAPGKQLPKFSDPEQSPIIKKIVDKQNYEVVLDDEELGLKHKNDVAQGFFDEYRDFSKLYRVIDVQDNYVYPDEYIAIEKFGLDLQIKYFSLGNRQIVEAADNPESSSVLSTTKKNIQTLIGNYNIYLDNVNEEKSFTSAIPSFIEGIEVYFDKLIKTYPDANYDGMLNKARLMEKKAQATELKESLAKLILKLESLKEPEATPTN